MATVTSVSVDLSARSKAIESSASVISGCLSDSDEYTIESDEQIIEETIVDETESTVTVESIIDETQICFCNQLESSKLECSEICVSSTSKIIEGGSNGYCSSSNSSTSADSNSEYYPNPMKRARVNPVDLGNRDLCVKQCN